LFYIIIVLYNYFLVNLVNKACLSCLVSTKDQVAYDMTKFVVKCDKVADFHHESGYLSLLVYINVLTMEQNYHNRDIFVENYDTYADDIFRYCSFRVFDRERARDLMQETFTKTWEYMEKGKEIENMRAFLYKVAHNLCVNEVIRPKAYSLDEMTEKVDFDPRDNMTRSPEDEAETSILMQKMQMLEPQEREILTMRYVNDLAVFEIAELLGMIPNSVSVKIHRAEESLRKLYKTNEQ
jgi:RNA polymerase sigma-70 factor, ECF subfamily